MEEYLFHRRDHDQFYTNLSGLPFDERAIVIRSVFGLKRFDTLASGTFSKRQPSTVVLSSAAKTLEAFRKGTLQRYSDLVALIR